MEDWPTIYSWFPRKYLICNMKLKENCIWIISFCHSFSHGQLDPQNYLHKDECLKAIMPLQQKYVPPLMYMYVNVRTNSIVSYVLLSPIFSLHLDLKQFEFLMFVIMNWQLSLSQSSVFKLKIHLQGSPVPVILSDQGGKVFEKKSPPLISTTVKT